MLIAGVLNLLLVAMLSFHSKSDEAVWDACWDGAAHVWDDQKQVKNVRYCLVVTIANSRLSKKRKKIENIFKMLAHWFHCSKFYVLFDLGYN